MSRAILLVATLLAVGAPPALAHHAERHATRATAALRDVGFDQRLDARVPGDVVLRDTRGRPVRLATLLDERPVVLTLTQFGCPDLCPVELEGLGRVLGGLGLRGGRDYRVVSVSIDPREGPAEALPLEQRYAGRAGGDWRFLTAEADAVARLTAAVGYRYVRDAASGGFAHPAGLVVLTPDGTIARYLFGLDYLPRDLRLALVEAGQGRVGSPIDRLLLACYRYDAAHGRYTPMVLTVVRVTGVLTVVGLGAGLLLLFRADRRRGRAGAAAGEDGP